MSAWGGRKAGSRSPSAGAPDRPHLPAPCRSDQDRLNAWAEGFISGAVSYMAHQLRALAVNIPPEHYWTFYPLDREPTRSGTVVNIGYEHMDQFRAHCAREANAMARTALADPAVREKILHPNGSPIVMKVGGSTP